MSLSGVGLLGWYESQAMYTMFTVQIYNSYLRNLLQPVNKITSCLLTGPNGEPKITHGNTLVSELSLKEVARTIDVRS